jgi:hypothetical protein
VHVDNSVIIPTNIVSIMTSQMEGKHLFSSLHWIQQASPAQWWNTEGPLHMYGADTSTLDIYLFREAVVNPAPISYQVQNMAVHLTIHIKV